LATLKTRSILLVVVLVVAVIAAGEYYSGTFGSGGSSAALNLNMQILGGVGPGTVDIYSPDNFTVTKGEQVNLAILNTDDNTHGFVMKQFGVDTGLILPGHTTRVNFVANQTGMFEFLEPPSYCTGGIDHHCNSVQHMWGYMTVGP
jgi:heme/copper-type cytochrome/quinol oxidase subunit 2